MIEIPSEKVISKLRHLQKLRMILTSGHSFVFRDYTALQNERRFKIIRIPKYIAEFFGLKDKTTEEYLYPTLMPSHLAVILLFVALFCGAALTPIFKSFTTTNPTLPPTWRFAINLIFLLPLIWRETRSEYKDLYKLDKIFSKTTILNNIWRAFLFTAWSVFFVLGLSYTVLYNALILSNSHIFFIVIWSLLRRKIIPPLNFIGSILVIGGILLLFLTNQILGTPGNEYTTIGNIFSLLASLSAAIFYFNNKEIDTDIPYYFRLFLINLFSLVFSALISTLVFKAEFNFNPVTGLFGFIHYRNLSGIIALGLFTCYGTFGLYFLLAKVFDPLLIAGCLLVEPILSGIMCYAMSFSDTPYFITFLGILLIPPGLLLILVGEQQVEDRFEGGEIGIPLTTIGQLRIKHYANLDKLQLDKVPMDSLDFENPGI